MAIDFSAVADAGITKTEFAKLVGVTRVTAHNWMDDGKAPSPYLDGAVRELLVHIRSAVNAGLLPGQLAFLPPSRHTVEERRKVIEDAIARVKGA